MPVSTNNPHWFLPHDRELGKLIADIDWKRTSMGPIDSWPAALRHALALMLRADVPMAMFHGTERNFVYNDAFRAIIGEHHPRVLGKPAADAWPDSDAFGADVLDAVLAGQAPRGRHLSLDRTGDAGTIRVDYSPLIAEDGRAIAVIVFASDVREARPFAAEDATQGGTASEAEHAGAVRIVVVEDDWLVRTTLAEMLQVHGHQVREASDGQRALELLAEAEADLLITDVGLPGMSGVELADAARASYPRLAVIFATGNAHAEGVVPGERSGVLVKPFGSEALTTAVSRLFPASAHARSTDR